MSLKVKCPGCTKMLTVPDAARGKAIKCPNCEVRVPVPSGEEEAPAASSAKAKKPVKSAKPVEDESGLAKLDLRKAADHEASVCPKCGYDMDLVNTDEDSEVTECPQCGWDVAEGGLGEKARKKALKGPDPDKFYQGLWRNSWKFVKENYFLAFRTYGYTMAASLIMFFSIFMYLWISMWPPRLFFAFVATIAAMVIPGWFWYLDTEVIKLTLERRDKFKRLNFDFFLASALGVKFFVWNIVFAGPLLLIPGLIGGALWWFAGVPLWVGAIILAVCYIPIFGLWPVSLTHMTMPIETPAWMFWKVIPTGFRCFKALFVWFLLFTVTNFPVLLIGAVSLFFTAPALMDYAEIMESNGILTRTQAIADYYSSYRKKPPDLVEPKSLTELAVKGATQMGDWYKQPGDEVHLGDALFSYKSKDGEKTHLASARGTLEKITALKGQALTDATPLGEIKPSVVDFPHELAITICMMSWLFGGLILAFTSLFSMRANGYFAYYFREYLDLQVLVKERKYVAKISRDGKEVKPLTAQDMFGQAAGTILVCVLIVSIIRLVMAALDNNGDMGLALLFGVFGGLQWSVYAGFGVITKAAWEESPMWGLLTQWFNVALGVVGVVLGLAYMLGMTIPLPFQVLLALMLLLAVASIVASFVFVIQFWNEAGAGCLTAIIAVLLAMIMVPISILAFQTNLLALPKSGANAPVAPQQNPLDPANPAAPPATTPPGTTPIDVPVVPTTPGTKTL